MILMTRVVSYYHLDMISLYHFVDIWQPMENRNYKDFILLRSTDVRL